MVWGRRELKHQRSVGVCVQVLEYSGTCKRSHAFIPEGRESLRFVSPTGSWSGKEQRESGIVGIRGS